MALKVRTLYLNAFNMPQTCVSCGAPADPLFKWKAGWGQPDKLSLSVDFPVCSDCGEAITKKSKGSAKFVMGFFILLSPFACLLTSTGVNSVVANKGYIGILAGLAALFLVVFLGSKISDLIDTSGFTPNQKQEWKKQQKIRKQRLNDLKRSVKIEKVELPALFKSTDHGHIDFKFENALFATEFASLNLGQLINK